MKLKFNGGCLKQHKLIYTHGTIVNIHIVYELGASSSFNDDPTLKNSSFGAVTLTKNDDIDSIDSQVLVLEKDVFLSQVVGLVKMQ